MTQDSIRLLPLSDNDHAAWLPLWRGYQSFYKTDIPAEVSAVTWSRLLDPKEPMGGALAWDGTTAVGLVQPVLMASRHAGTSMCFRVVNGYSP